MAFLHLILFLFVQLTVVFTQISWENCASKTSDIKLLNLTINPDPIIAPGMVSVTVTIYTNQNLTSPLKAVLSLKKKTLIGYITVPCFSIGSCIYDDLCTQGNCSMQTGEHTFTLPITIESSSWMLVGNYQAQIDLKIGSGQKTCVRINNIYIKTKK